MSAVLRALGAVLCTALLGLGLAACRSGSAGDAQSSSQATSHGSAGSSSSQAPKPSSKPRPTGSASATPSGQNQDVPQRVRDTLAHIDAGDWPAAANAPGTHGGDPFGNNEGRLPAKTPAGKSIHYKEWDVNPKKQGQGRDAERIVTGDDGSAWYTLDHYSHFTRIR